MHTGDSVATGRVSQPIINSTDSTSAQDWVIQIQIEATGPGAPPGGVCTGSLIAPNLVLTARHCVSRGKGVRRASHARRTAWRPTTTAPRAGTDFAPTAFQVLHRPEQPGGRRDPRAIGKKVIHDGATTLCARHRPHHPRHADQRHHAGEDAPRRAGAVGELVTAIGWGVTTTESPTPAVLQSSARVSRSRKVGPRRTTFRAASSRSAGRSAPATAVARRSPSPRTRCSASSRAVATPCPTIRTTSPGLRERHELLHRALQLQDAHRGRDDGSRGRRGGPDAGRRRVEQWLDDDDRGGAPTKEDSGCSTTAGGSSPWGSIGLALAGMLVLGARRRRR